MSGVAAGSPLASSPNSPGVSVIIPTRNRKHFLRRALDSLLQQNYPNLEIIVVDDGSTDGTDELIAEYGNQIRYFHFEVNQGPSAARNYAFEHSKNPYIAFLDSDDYWAPNRLSTLMSAWKEAPESCGIIANDISLFDDEDRHFAPKRLSDLKSGPITTEQLLLRNRFAPSAAMMSREAYQRCGGFDDCLLASEDRDLWIRVSQHYSIYFIAKPLTLMRKHPANISKEASRMQTSILAMLRKSYRRAVLPRWRIDLWLKALSFGLFVIACLNNYERRTLRAWCFLVSSCMMWPVHTRTREDLNEPVLFRLRMFYHFLCVRLATKTRPTSRKLAKTA